MVQTGLAQADDIPRTAFVHLFEWKWTDVANECEVFLGPKGFAAVQISPPQEHRVVADGSRKFPWWQRYQPVSYKLDSRSGTRQELADMISRCNQAGIKIYADVVINHMAGTDLGPGIGSAGSAFDPSVRDFPAVPYGSGDFHNQCAVSYDSAESIRNCWIEGTLTDLDTGKEHVRQKIADFMNDLLSIGVAGFRIDAAKHIPPEDIAAILNKVGDLGAAIDPQTGAPYHPPGRPYIFMEVIGAPNEPVQPTQYTAYGNVTEFAYGVKVAGKFRDPGQTLSQLKTFPGHPGSTDWGLLSSPNAVAFLDNHDNQRGHGSGAWQCDGRIANILAFHYDGRLYNLANVFMLAWPYGYPKAMSSYDWQRNIQHMGGKCVDVNDWQGPPADAQGRTKGVDCADSAWICEHRWDNIADMVAFRNYTGRNPADWTVTHWWDNGADQIAFGRNGKGFVVINKAGGTLNRVFDTGMAPGTYCDVLHGDFNDETNSCVGTIIQVDANGQGSFMVAEGEAAAIHVGAMIGSGNSYKRTIVFMFGITKPGQDMFLRGGIDHTLAQGMLGRTCTTSAGPTYDCAMPIRHRNHRNATTEPWKHGDQYLDWYGQEPGQILPSHGITAVGTPLDWTTNNPAHGATVAADGFGFESLNQMRTLGDHYWMLDVDMDCSKGVQAAGESWFELKSFISNVDNGWEGNILQPDAPYESQNHFAKCGKINIFRRNENAVEYIDF